MESKEKNETKINKACEREIAYQACLKKKNILYITLWGRFKDVIQCHLCLHLTPFYQTTLVSNIRLDLDFGQADVHKGMEHEPVTAINLVAN